MSFRKRSVPLASKSSSSPFISSQTQLSSADGQSTTSSPAGVRPSPLSGIPTLSTGTPTLDSLLGGHSGLPLGSSLLISENGTTDYAGALLRLYAAEGVMQGCQVHVVGAPGGEAWGRELPGLAGVKAEKEEGRLGAGTGREVDKEKMKIAWRYEGLGRERERERGAWSLRFCCRYMRDKYMVLVHITHASECFHPALHAELIADTNVFKQPISHSEHPCLHPHQLHLQTQNHHFLHQHRVPIASISPNGSFPLPPLLRSSTIPFLSIPP